MELFTRIFRSFAFLMALTKALKILQVYLIHLGAVKDFLIRKFTVESNYVASIITATFVATVNWNLWTLLFPIAVIVAIYYSEWKLLYKALLLVVIVAFSIDVCIGLGNALNCFFLLNDCHYQECSFQWTFVKALNILDFDLKILDTLLGLKTCFDIEVSVVLYQLFWLVFYYFSPRPLTKLVKKKNKKIKLKSEWSHKCEILFYTTFRIGCNILSLYNIYVETKNLLKNLDILSMAKSYKWDWNEEAVEAFVEQFIEPILGNVQVIATHIFLMVRMYQSDGRITRHTYKAIVTLVVLQIIKLFTLAQTEDSSSKMFKLLMRSSDLTLFCFEDMLPRQEIAFGVELSDLFNVVFCYVLFEYSRFQDKPLPKFHKKTSVTSLVTIQKLDIDIYPEEFWYQCLVHSCLYGHKERLRKLLEKKPQENMGINVPTIHGFHPIHLAVWSGELATVQILIAKFHAKLMKLNVRNDDGHNPLDMAIIKDDYAMTRLLIRHQSKPEISSLIHALPNRRQHHIISKLAKSLTSVIGVKDIGLNCQLERYVALCKEVELKSTSQERKAKCHLNLKVYESNIIPQLWKILKQEEKNRENEEKEENEEEQEKSVKEKKTTVEVEVLSSLLDEYECPVCFHLIKPPRRIYACSNDHYTCSTCMVEIKACPICREDFETALPKIRTTTETTLSKILDIIGDDDIC